MPNPAILTRHHRITSSWTPATLGANLREWWDAADATTFTYSSGVVVSEWRDKSGNGRHLAPPAAGREPSRSGTINGRASVVFDGTSDALLSNTTTAPSKPITYLLVAKNTAASGQRNAMHAGFGGSVDGRVFRTSAGVLSAYQGSFLNSSASWGTTAAHSVVTVFNGASSKIAVNSGSWTTGDAGSPAFGSRWCLGALEPGTSEWWQGDICEAAVVTGTISDANRDAWFAYAATKWGTP